MKTACEAVAESLRRFGYSDATAEMAHDCWRALNAGGFEKDMPHGIIGRFAYSQLNENQEWLAKLPPWDRK